MISSSSAAIKALSVEEQELLNQKFKHKSNWQSLRSRILANAQAIEQRRSGQPLQPDIDPIIQQMREEREQQLLADVFDSEAQS